MRFGLATTLGLLRCSKSTVRRQTGYWILVCNPRKWAVDRFLQSGRTRDRWGVRPSDARHFQVGHHAAPTVQESLSRRIERGPIGDLVKQANGHRCQICEQLDLNPIAFLKAEGTPYVEAHHVVPVSEQQVGSLSAANVITVCPNHHRQLHYGDVLVEIGEEAFQIRLGGNSMRIPKFGGSKATA